jgi:hypothetical protein
MVVLPLSLLLLFSSSAGPQAARMKANVRRSRKKILLDLEKLFLLIIIFIKPRYKKKPPSIGGGFFYLRFRSYCWVY